MASNEYLQKRALGLTETRERPEDGSEALRIGLGAAGELSTQLEQQLVHACGVRHARALVRAERRSERCERVQGDAADGGVVPRSVGLDEVDDVIRRRAEQQRAALRQWVAHRARRSARARARASVFAAPRRGDAARPRGGAARSTAFVCSSRRAKSRPRAGIAIVLIAVWSQYISATRPSVTVRSAKSTAVSTLASCKFSTHSEAVYPKPKMMMLYRAICT